MNNLVTSCRFKFFSKLRSRLTTTKETILILCPYIRSEILEELIKTVKAKNITIVTSWGLQDLLYGASDLELYNYCKKNNIFLYLNPRIHLKAFIIDDSKCIFGSANVTSKGLALHDDYNYELFSNVIDITSSDLLYFKKILNESILVDDRIYDFYCNKLKSLEKPKHIPEIEITKLVPDKEFLISSLPMSYDIDEFYEIYSNDFKHKSKEKVQCAIHDVALYDMPPDLTKDEFLTILSKRFFASEFISKLILIIDERGMYFGRVKEWIQKNCTDVPVPSRRSLTGNIQVLYKWIVRLSNGEYKVDRPNYSERIYRAK